MDSSWERRDTVSLLNEQQRLAQGPRIGLELLRIEWELARRAEWSLRPHEAGRWRRSAMDRCAAGTPGDVSPQDGARAALMCAMLDADRTGLEPLWAQPGSSRRIGAALERASHGRLGAELDFAEAWIAASLPPWHGQDLRRSAVAWTWLSRGQADSAAVTAGLARTALLQRNGRRVDALLHESAHAGTDALTPLQTLEGRRAVVDGIRIGVQPLLFAGARGLWLGVGAIDERIADTRRSVRAAVAGSTAGELEARLGYADSEMLSPFRWDATLRARDGVEDYYGAAVAARPSRVVGWRGAATSGIALPLGELILVRSGWRVVGRAVRRADDPFVAASERGAWHGPELGVELDTRDSRFAPRAGVLASAHGALLGGWRSWRVAATGWLPLGWRQSAWLGAAVGAVPSDAPLGLYPALRDDMALPGVRDARLEAPSLVGFQAGIERTLGFGVSAAAFAVAASPGRDGGRSWLWGGGVRADVRLTRLTRPSVRLETGWASGEWSWRLGTVMDL